MGDLPYSHAHPLHQFAGMDANVVLHAWNVVVSCKSKFAFCTVHVGMPDHELIRDGFPRFAWDRLNFHAIELIIAVATQLI